MVDEEVAIKVFDTGILWILSCSIKILLQRNNVFKRREVLDRMPSSSTACAVPLPRWGRLNRPPNQNLKNSNKRGTARKSDSSFMHIQLNCMNLVLCIRIRINAVLFVLSMLEELERNLLEESIGKHVLVLLKISCGDL